LADQLRSYYECEFRCCRNWWPMFIYLMQTICCNAYILSRLSKSAQVTHANFLMALVRQLIARATDLAVPSRIVNLTTPTDFNTRRLNRDHAAPLPAKRNDPVPHVALRVLRTEVDQRRRCFLCSWERQGRDSPKTSAYCKHCKEFLFYLHFSASSFVFVLFHRFLSCVCVTLIRRFGRSELPRCSV